MTDSLHFEKRLTKFLHRLNPQETLTSLPILRTDVPANGANERELENTLRISALCFICAHSRDSRAKSELLDCIFHETTAC